MAGTQNKQKASVTGAEWLRKGRAGNKVRDVRDVNKGSAHIGFAGLVKVLEFNSKCDRSPQRALSKRIIFSGLYFKKRILVSITLT